MAELKNVRHEKFAQGIANGMTQRKAYHAAFPNSKKWKDTTVDSKASELAKTGKVLERLKELAEETSSKAVMTATKRKEWLSDIIRSENEKTRDKLKAVDILNRMEGEYTDKVEVEDKRKSPYDELSVDELKALAEMCEADET